MDGAVCGHEGAGRAGRDACRGFGVGPRDGDHECKGDREKVAGVEAVASVCGDVFVERAHEEGCDHRRKTCFDCEQARADEKTEYTEKTCGDRLGAWRFREKCNVLHARGLDAIVYSLDVAIFGTSVRFDIDDILCAA